MNEEHFLRAMEKGDLEEAERILGSIKDKIPRTRSLYFEGMVLDGLGEPEEALKKFNMALVLHLSDPSIWLAKARVLQELGKIDMARRAVDRACRLSSGNSSAHLLHAEILYQMKDHKGAMTQIDEALELAPEDPEILTLKGILVSILEEDYRKALGYFDKALTSDEGHAPAWTNRGVALRVIGDRDGSIYSFQKALMLDGEDRTALEMLKHMGAEKFIVHTDRTPKDRRRARRTMHLIDEAPRGSERGSIGSGFDELEEVDEEEMEDDIDQEDFDELEEDWQEEEEELEVEEMEEYGEEDEEEGEKEDLDDLKGAGGSDEEMEGWAVSPRVPARRVTKLPIKESGDLEDWGGTDEIEEELEEMEDDEDSKPEALDTTDDRTPLIVPPAPRKVLIKKKKNKKVATRKLDLDCPRCGATFKVNVKGRTSFSCPSCGLSGQIE